MLSHQCFILGPDRRFIFAFVPKVACTNWKCLLRHLHGLPDYLNSKLAHARKESGLPFLFDVQNPWGLLNDPTIPKLTCVRNPYTRILSAYLNKIEPFLQTDNANLPSLLASAFGKIFATIDKFRKLYYPQKLTVDFETFVSWLEVADARDPFAADLHWLPQTMILGSGQVEFAHVAKFENLAQDAAHLLAVMGCSIDFPTQREVRFAPTGADGKSQQYYTANIVERVARLYRDDFAVFGYDANRHPLADANERL